MCAGLLHAWASLKWPGLLPLDFVQVQFEDKGEVGGDSQVPGHVAGDTVGSSMCSHEFYSGSALGLTCPSCTMPAVHSSHCKWEPGHRVLSWVMWL